MIVALCRMILSNAARVKGFPGKSFWSLRCRLNRFCLADGRELGGFVCHLVAFPTGCLFYSGVGRDHILKIIVSDASNPFLVSNLQAKKQDPIVVGENSNSGK